VVTGFSKKKLHFKPVVIGYNGKASAPLTLQDFINLRMHLDNITTTTINFIFQNN
jgi:hypothetical protein